MQAVILAAGKSTRTYPLTLTKPKPLLRVANKTIIEHNLDQLVGMVQEVIIVVGYKSEQVIDFLGENYRGISIVYVQQRESAGTAAALKSAKSQIKGDFILMFGDDLYSQKDIINLLKYKNAILATAVTNPANFGVLRVDGDRFIEVVEKPKVFISNLVSVGCFIFSYKFLDILDDIHLSERGEYELTDGYNLFAKQIEVNVVEVVDYWLPITYPWSLLSANHFILQRLAKSQQLGDNVLIEKNVSMGGAVVIENDTIIKSGVYIEEGVVIGSNCVIGPNCYIRTGSSIGNHCHIGHAVEIKNSVIGNYTHVAHLSYVGDSVLGEGVNLGAGTVTANLRHDKKNIISRVKGNKIDSGLMKLGVVLGDKVKTGINTAFYPGVKMDPETITLPGEVVKCDVVK